MGDFDGQRWRPYLDEEARERRDEIIEHLKRNYDGPSDFIKQKLIEEETLSIDEKIQKLEDDVEEKKEDLQKFKTIKREREQQDKLRDKKELLKQKQSKLEEIRDEGVDSFHEIMMYEIKQREKRGYDCSDPELARTVLNRAERKFEKQPDVDELVEEVERLQRQVKELNGGREDWFLDLQSVEVSA